MFKLLKLKLLDFLFISFILLYIIIPFHNFSTLFEKLVLSLIVLFTILKLKQKDNLETLKNVLKDNNILTKILTIILFFNFLGIFFNFNFSYLLTNIYNSTLKIVIFLIIAILLKNDKKLFSISFIALNIFLGIAFLINSIFNIKVLEVFSFSLLSIYFSISIFTSLNLLSYYNNKRIKIYLIIATTFLLTTLILTKSTLNILITLGILVIYAVYLLPFKKIRNFKHTLILKAFFASIIFLVPIILIKSHYSLKEVYQSLNINMPVLYTSGELIILNPLFGVGSNLYFKKIINLDRGLFYYTPFKNNIAAANSTFLFLAIENGLIVTLLFIFILITISYKLALKFQNEKSNLAFSLLLTSFAYLCFLFFNNLLITNNLLLLLIIEIVFLIPRNNNKNIFLYSKKNINVTNIIYSILFTTVINFGIFALLSFKVFDLKYRPIMEKTRNSYLNSIENKLKTVENNLEDFCVINYCTFENKTNYFKTLNAFGETLKNYVKEKNSRYYKSRPFIDMYNHLEDLEFVSYSFSEGSIKNFFEITLPFQVSNYSSKKVLLPYYGYTSHNADIIFDNLYLVYYINKGFHYNPLVAIRASKTMLENKEYEAFFKLHQLINSLMDKKEHNNINFKTASYFFNFNDYDPGWSSGMAQGVLVEISAEAYRLTKDPYYQDFIEELLPAFYIEYTDGGLIYSDPKTNFPFLLEYTYGHQERELNGSIIGAFGLRKWYTISKDKNILSLYKNLIQEILLTLPDYDSPEVGLPENSSWSKYNLIVDSCPKSYHELHINLLYNLANDPFITKLKNYEKITFYLERWKNAYQFKYPEEDINKFLKSAF